MKRGDVKRLLRQATAERIRLERAEMELAFEGLDGDPAPLLPRLEEAHALKMLKSIPSVFAIAEKMNPKYIRPLWADQRYGAN